MKSESVSIIQDGPRRARSLAIQICIAGFITAALTVIGISIFESYQRLNYVARAVESNIASSLLVGDSFQLSRLTESLSKGDGVLSVSILDLPSGKVIAHSGEIGMPQPSGAGGGRISLVRTSSGIGVALREIVKSDAQEIGELLLVCALPIVWIGILLGLIALLFVVAAHFIVVAARNTALSVTVPTGLFAEELKNSVSTGVFRELPASVLRFTELVTIQDEFKALLERLAQAREHDKQVTKEAVVGRIATKVRHDVKQALLASNAAVKRLAGKAEDLALMSASLQRIESTVNEIPKIRLSTDDVSAQSSGVGSEIAQVRSHLIVGLIEPVIAEFRALISESGKRTDLAFVVDGDQMQLFVEVELTHFRRMLANLLANAIDATPNGGNIEVAVSVREGSIELAISDTGKGISSKILPKIGAPGFSYGKPGGSGLGLSSAIEYVSGWGGTLKISSTDGVGTCIKIELPKAAPDASFLGVLVIPRNGHLLVIDDDPTVHEIWRSRLIPEELSQLGVSVSWFFDGDEARPLVERLKREQQEFLILADYDLGHGKSSGLDVIRKLGVCDRSVVISSGAEEPDIIRDCRLSSVPLVSKALQSFIPIQVA